MLPIFHVHHHLRRRHDHGAHIVKRMNAGIGQPVVEPHGVRTGGKGVGEGQTAFRTAINGFFQAGRIGNATGFELVRQGDRPGRCD